MTKERPRLLCVDDEAAVVDSLSLHLDREYEVLTALSGAEALEILRAEPEVAVVISDMRMPGMTGSDLLAAIRKEWPDTVRMLLTGYADIDATIAAVNEGQIFRFLMKPCPPDQLRAAVEAGVRQHELVRAERELLEETLRGAVRALTDVLALADPLAFGRAKRLKLVVVQLAEALGMPDPWQVEVAVMMSQVAAVTLPPTVVDKLYYGMELDEDEAPMVARMPGIAAGVLAGIPRLDGVEAIIRGLAAGPDDDAPLGSRVIRAAMELDTLEAGGVDPVDAVAKLRYRGHYPAVVSELERLCTPVPIVRELRVFELETGMVLAEDIRSVRGMLLVPKGYEVDHALLERLGHIPAQSIQHPLRVHRPAGGEQRSVAAGGAG